MAYNLYQPYYQPGQIFPGLQQMQNQGQQISQVQNSGFISVRSETEARNYPVAYGNSVTFKDETQPYIYTKTMGFSQLDQPKFDKFKLVKEDSEDSTSVPDTTAVPQTNEDVEKLKSDVEKLRSEFDDLKMDIEELSNSVNIMKKKATTKKVE